MLSAMRAFTGREIADAGLIGWAYLLRGLQTRIRTTDFATGVALVAAIGAAADEVGLPPEVDLRAEHLDVRISSRSDAGVTEQAVELARAVGRAATAIGLTPSTAGLARIEAALDTPDRAAVLPFWAAVLAIEPPAAAPGETTPDELPDPAGVLPTLWFQPSGRDDPRQRWHPDVWVDPVEVPARMTAALAAGGRLVSDAEAPSFWVLADPDDNQVCLCTWQDRG